MSWQHEMNDGYMLLLMAHEKLCAAQDHATFSLTKTQLGKATTATAIALLEVEAVMGDKPVDVVRGAIEANHGCDNPSRMSRNIVHALRQAELL